MGELNGLRTTDHGPRTADSGPTTDPGLRLARALAESSRDPRTAIVCLLACRPGQRASLDWICRWFGGKNPERTESYVTELQFWGVVAMSAVSSGNRAVVLVDPGRLPRLRPVPAEEVAFEFPDDLALAGCSPSGGGVSPASAVRVAPAVGEVRTRIESSNRDKGIAFSSTRVESRGRSEFWSDPYVQEKLAAHRRLRDEMAEGRTSMVRRFAELYRTKPDRARELLGLASALGCTADGRQPNRGAWLNVSLAKEGVVFA